MNLRMSSLCAGSIDVHCLHSPTAFQTLSLMVVSWLETIANVKLQSELWILKHCWIRFKVCVQPCFHFLKCVAIWSPCTVIIIILSLLVWNSNSFSFTESVVNGQFICAHFALSLKMLYICNDLIEALPILNSSILALLFYCSQQFKCCSSFSPFVYQYHLEFLVLEVDRPFCLVCRVVMFISIVFWRLSTFQSPDQTLPHPFKIVCV